MGFLSAETQDVTSGSTVFTVPTGCTFLLVKMAHTTAGAPSTKTLGGTALTLISGRDNTDGMYAAIYERASPAIGAITLAHNSIAGGSHATLEYYDGIASVRNSAQAGGTYATSFTLNVTSVAGDLCSDLIAVQEGGTPTQGGSQTLVVGTTFFGGLRMFGASRRTASGTSTTHSWTTSGAGQRQAHIAVSLIPSGGSAVAKSVFPFFLR
jgi:hypothetical protein